MRTGRINKHDQDNRDVRTFITNYKEYRDVRTFMTQIIKNIEM